MGKVLISGISVRAIPNMDSKTRNVSQTGGMVFSVKDSTQGFFSGKEELQIICPELMTHLTQVFHLPRAKELGVGTIINDVSL